MSPEQPLRFLPAIEKLLQHERLQSLSSSLSSEILTQCTRRAVATLRASWMRHVPESLDEARALEQAVALTFEEAARLLTPSLKKVINATGVILHTGLGRAVLSSAAKTAMQEVLDGYCNLELDLATGKRGDRHQHVERLLRELTGAEAACVVNNNAAAVLLALNTFANKKEIITSRGQLVEIGGSFRMPEVVKKSGARLVEIGTTNKTKLADYANAITPRTAGFLMVHTSNYRILGFTHEVELRELARLAREKNVLVVHDLGGGVLVDLRQWGLPYEPVVAESIAAGAEVVTFSGDKVLGGPQCGLLVGKRDLISKVKKNPLMRALRCDKLTLALLESTLRLFLNPSRLTEQHEVFRMMTEPLPAVQQRAEQLKALLHASFADRLQLSLEPSESEAGSGALPLEKIPSHAVVLQSPTRSAHVLAHDLRMAPAPVLGYVREDRLWLDARTLRTGDLPVILSSLDATRL
ncbi:L-seryl-tRNA(Sec) selenium transferase [candidate division KSB1 bacterium]|nr:L-seryl-tRNA(Sec) selenium transferase [candidate division KSB1 bacterium]